MRVRGATPPPPLVLPDHHPAAAAGTWKNADGTRHRSEPCSDAAGPYRRGVRSREHRTGAPASRYADTGLFAVSDTREHAGLPRAQM
ncbi:hypothetical protein EF879_02385 [Micromonospora sp. HM5-17]|nr:hypothetical protein EF879_02385 [Micromonospora sp. HM5-17]